MYTHISMFRFKDRAQLETHRAEIQARMEAFPHHIPTIRSCQVVANVLPQPEQAPPTLLFCDLVQIITFDSRQALEAYPHDPHHMAMVKETDHLLERVCLIDFES